MPPDRRELGRRLRVAREACRMNQKAVAQRLGVSRSTVAQMELGNRAVMSLELDRLATLYARDIRDFMADNFLEEDALSAPFRAHPDVPEHASAPILTCLHARTSSRGCAAVWRLAAK